MELRSEPSNPSSPAVVVAQALRSSDSQHRILALLLLLHFIRTWRVEVRAQGQLVTAGQLLAQLRTQIQLSVSTPAPDRALYAAEDSFRYGLVRTSKLLRKIAVCERFHLTFQVIDRQGVTYNAPTPLLYRLISAPEHPESEDRVPMKRGRSRDSALHGNTEVRRVNAEPLVFADLWVGKGAVGRRLQMRVECVDKEDIKALDLPIVKVVSRKDEGK